MFFKDECFYYIVIKIENVNNVGAYVCKYMGKNFEDDRLDGKKRYFSSRGLIKPITIKDEENVSKIISQIPEKYIKKRNEFDRKHNGKNIGTVCFTITSFRRTGYDENQSVDFL